MATTMKAYRWISQWDGLTLEDLPVPSPSPTQALFKVEACGICHSDLHIVAGMGWQPSEAVTLGHEVSGTIIRVGKDVSEFNVGDQIVVAIPAHPVRVPAIGLHYNGGYAEYAVAEESNLIKLPENVTFAQAAVAADSMVTAYHAVTVQGEVDAGKTVAIIGLGGLGMMAARFSVLKGAVVYGVDTDQSKFDLAQQNGVKECFSDVVDVKDVLFDVVMDFVGISATINAAIDAVKDHGRVVLAGLGGESLSIPPIKLVYKSIELFGSLAGSKAELETVLDLIAAGSIAPALQEVRFEDLHGAFRLLASATLPKGRLFTIPKQFSPKI